MELIETHEEEQQIKENKIRNLKNDKTKVYGLILFSIIIFLVVLIILNNSGTFSPLNKYKKNTANILNDYLSTKISADDTVERLELIRKEVDVDYSKNNDLDYSMFSLQLGNAISSIRLNNVDKVMDFYNELK